MISNLLAAAALTIRLTNPMCLAPCTVKIVVHVEPAIENRTVDLTFEGGDYYRASQLNVTPYEKDGKIMYPPLSVEISYPRLGPGEYNIRAVLNANSGPKAVANAKAQVHGGVKQ